MRNTMCAVCLLFLLFFPLRSFADMDVNDFWQVKTSYDLDMRDGVSDWNSVKTSILRKTEDLVAEIGGKSAFRDGGNDEALFVDLYYSPFSEAKTYFNVASSISVGNNSFLPNSDSRFEAFHPIDDWELSGGIRFLDYDTDDIPIYSLGVSKYFGDFYARYKINLIDGKDVLNNFMIRYYFDYFPAPRFLEVGGGFGVNVVDILNNSNQVLKEDSYYAYTKYRHFFNKTWGVDLTYKYEEYDNLWSNNGIGAAVMYRW